MHNHISPTPWDTKVFGIPCFEITAYAEEPLAIAASVTGHYTIKVDPLANKELLQKYGFYYTDTLIEPVCRVDRFTPHQHADCSVRTDTPLDELLPMCDHTFLHGRFHRDFMLAGAAADQRYRQWLSQMHCENEVFALYYNTNLAGFIAHHQGNLLLHAIAREYRGQGLAKYFWSHVCDHLFLSGASEIRSSVSAANLAVLNLYASLGFRFCHATDIYHRLTRSSD
ncbi:GNAT family N-acetyltransferase [Mariprofundus erugo]|uniref:GNAT family N-acetyltransferase n=1 Tax=Mariprofundus erugo TaxID=2528639 RepID=UPI0010FE63B0|nr:GNAT family N-acetyltransferase [Mariprofundus erugo]TLS74923.1 GNAT family N-acetyltransferase [Mariprofundus erugo]